MVNNNLEIDTSPAFDFRGTGLDFASQKENWSYCEVSELTCVSLKLKI